MSLVSSRMGWLLVMMTSIGSGGLAHAAITSLTRVSAFDYDPVSGFLAKEIVEPGSSELCSARAHEYDAYGNRSKTTLRNCNGGAAAYPGSSAAVNSEAGAPSGGSLAVFDAGAQNSTTTYNADGTRQVLITNALGDSETRVYGAGHGLLAKLIGFNGDITRWAYDALGRKILEARSDGTGTRWSYDYCSGVNGGTVSCAAVGGVSPAYVVTKTPLRGPLDLGSPFTTGTVNGAIIKQYRDVLNRVLRIETQGFDGSAIFEDKGYDALGRLVSETRPYYNGQSKYVFTYEYDKLGRVIKVVKPDGAITTTSYNGLTTTRTNALNQVTVQARDELGRVVQVIDANGKSLAYAYDPFGNLLRTTDAAGNQVKMQYDMLGRKTAIQDPDTGAWAYDYNAAGEQVRQVDAKSQATTMSYDKLGRLIARNAPSLNTSWHFGKYLDGSACANGKGRLCEEVSSNGYSRKRYFDAQGRLIKTSTKVGARTFDTTWSYDVDGRPLNVAYPSGALTLQNIYNPRGYLHKVVDASNAQGIYWRADTWSAEQQILQETFGNGVATTYAHEPESGRLKSTVAGAANAVQNVAYTYDVLGNLKTRNDALTGVNATYGYDSLNRLQTETRSGGGLGSPQTIGWTYNDIGNVTSRSDVGTYAYGASGAASVRPHAVTDVNGTVNGVLNPTYAYDANGNLVSVAASGNVRTVTWTSFNMVDTVTQVVANNTHRLAYLYNPGRDRVQETYSKNNVLQRTTTYLNDGAELLYEEDHNNVSGATVKKHYIKVGGSTVGVLSWDGSAWDTKYWHKDHLGSPMVLSNAAGNVSERLAYEPFGKRRNVNGLTDGAGSLSSSTGDRGFTEHEMMDEVGLINMNGRVYDPAIGRFLSADPLVPDPFDQQSLNRYSYTRNNPTGAMDPTGFHDGSHDESHDDSDDGTCQSNPQACGLFPIIVTAPSWVPPQYPTLSSVPGVTIGPSFGMGMGGAGLGPVSLIAAFSQNITNTFYLVYYHNQRNGTKEEPGELGEPLPMIKIVADFIREKVNSPLWKISTSGMLLSMRIVDVGLGRFLGAFKDGADGDRPPINPNSPPPDNAYDPEGPKAPGRPSENEGFVPPKKGDEWVKNPNGRGYGWRDKGGDVWVPTGPSDPSRGDAHGGPHWDVQTPGGGYVNIYPGGGRR